MPYDIDDYYANQNDFLSVAETVMEKMRDGLQPEGEREELMASYINDWTGVLADVDVDEDAYQDSIDAW